jgi:hypothetical protein
MVKEKVFLVGLNKTATTSFHQLFLANGLKSYHNPNWVWKIKDPRDEIRKFQCFSDGYARNFPEVAKSFPDAIFVLTTRSLRAWIVSRFKHGYATLNSSFRTPKERGRHNWAYPPSKEKVISWIISRNNHHRKVLEYFKNQPSRLYLVNIENPGWQDFMGRELGLEVTNIEPANVIRKENVGIIAAVEDLVDKTFLELGYRDDQVNEYLINNRSDFAGIYKNNFSMGLVS